MDVSRIEAISPKKIDWRKLTAKDIIKFENQGVEVPSQYLQWAREFIQQVNSSDNDETTYEMATSQTQSAANPTAEDSETAEEPEKTLAQQKREDMQNSGVSLRGQARSFTKDSKTLSKEVEQSGAMIENIKTKSENELDTLETHMVEILSKAEGTKQELKTEIENVNSSKGDNSTIEKVNKLNQQLKQMGTKGQAQVVNAEVDFNLYDGIINNQTDLILNAIDFGSETIGVGNDLLSTVGNNFLFGIVDYIIGKVAVHSGEKAIESAQSTMGIQAETIAVNEENQSEVSGYKSDVEDKTQVEGIAVKKTSNDPEESENSAAITETEKAATANLEQILQAKIRKGQEINT
ncbi:hypothetical protein IJ541_01280 [bacterium]|nr:hypothetical protein [bacterium]